MPAGNGRKGFTLIELLVVVVILIIMISLGASLFKNTGQEVTRAADALSDILQQARTRAMSSNNYVYVGMAETLGTTPQLAVAVVESKSGLTSKTNNLSAAEIQPTRKITLLKGVRVDTGNADAHLPGNPLSLSTGVTIESLETDKMITFPSSVVAPGRDVPAAFNWVIQFSPDGAARLDATARTVPNMIVLGLVPQRGNPKNAVGFIIDGPSGAVRFVRP